MVFPYNIRMVIHPIDPGFIYLKFQDSLGFAGGWLVPSRRRHLFAPRPKPLGLVSPEIGLAMNRQTKTRDPHLVCKYDMFVLCTLLKCLNGKIHTMKVDSKQTKYLKRMCRDALHAAAFIHVYQSIIKNKLNAQNRTERFISPSHATGTYISDL